MGLELNILFYFYCFSPDVLARDNNWNMMLLMTPIAFESDLGCQLVLLFETLMRKSKQI